MYRTNYEAELEYWLQGESENEWEEYLNGEFEGIFSRLAKKARDLALAGKLWLEQQNGPQGKTREEIRDRDRQVQTVTSRPSNPQSPFRQQANEFEWEMEREFSSINQENSEILMEYLAHAATKSNNEVEAAAFIGALLPLAARMVPQANLTLIRNSPDLVRGLTVVNRILRSSPATRSLVRTIPAIVRRTAGSINQQLAEGRKVTPQTAVRSLEHQAYKLLSNPQQLRHALHRSDAMLEDYSNFYSNPEMEDEWELRKSKKKASQGKKSTKSDCWSIYWRCVDGASKKGDIDKCDECRRQCERFGTWPC
ncbi:MAG TPA: hypothetical protein DDZ80_00990 [Cyanobacteria bacterium UBA8803]|nr:hypothetical protein [Cyanobacteria bacterium UBA9273]HBL57183.1 hypothetical protein [Cyanobacteria bacterium UBA8803]